MRASVFVKKIQKAIDIHGDLPIIMDLTFCRNLSVKKVGPYSKQSSKDYAGKTFIEIEASEEKRLY